MSFTPSRNSVIMMTNTGRNHNLVGDPIRADGYYNRSDGLHTVQVIYSNFTGNFGLQGTLSVTPEEGDWFYISLNSPYFSSSISPLVSYPKNPLAPTNGGGGNGDSGTDAFTFVGNFVWLRAILDRSNIPEPSPTESVTELGNIEKVILAL